MSDKTTSEGAKPALETPLAALHRELGGKLVAFAGYLLPINYPAGIIAEHKATRASAGLFDVSHMGQIRVEGEGAAEALEALIPVDLIGLEIGRQRYGYFTNETGGIEDDLMIARDAVDRFTIVANAANKAADMARLKAGLPAGVSAKLEAGRALIALQGPAAETALARLVPAVAGTAFMDVFDLELAGAACRASRSGYTGEDGFEISVPGGRAEMVARLLLAEPEVSPAGLGARDSLRLEAGLPLHGHEITAEITPVEAGLTWAMAKRRRQSGDFPGAAIILSQLKAGPPRRPVALVFEDRVPARDGAELATPDGKVVGVVTSGTYSPSLDKPIALGLVEAGAVELGQPLDALVRGKPRRGEVVKPPFVPRRYKR